MGICYDWSSDNDNAFEEYHKSLEIRKEVYGENHIDVVRGYKFIGDMFAWDWQNLNAIEYLSKATDLYATINCKDNSVLGETYYSLASVSRRLRDLEKAGIYGLKSLSLFENDPYSRSRSYNLIANVNEHKNEFEQALRFNTLAISLLQEHQPLSSSQQRNLANYLHSFANVYMRLQKYDSAQKYYQRSLQLYNSLGDRDDVLLVYQNIGLNYYWLGQQDSADYFLSKAIRLRKQNYGQQHVRTSASLRAKGTFHENQGQLDSALFYYQQAIVAGSSQEFDSEELTENPRSESFIYDDDANLLKALYSKGKALRKYYIRDKHQKDLELSLKTLLLTIDLMDQNQQSFLLEGSTLLMAEDYYSVFEDALDVCYILYQLTQSRRYLESAFLIMEKSKARLLFDSFSDLQQSQMVGIPDSMMNMERSIKSSLASFARNLEYEKSQDPIDPQKVRELENQEFELTVKLEQFRESLKSQYPSYVSAVKNEPLPLDVILNKIEQENRILVNYFWGDSALFSVILQRDRIKFYRQSIDTLDQLVTTYQSHLFQAPQFNNQAVRFKEFYQSAHGLYKRLFNGVESGDERIVIAADGPLRFIPFEALVVTLPEDPSNDYSKLDYLLRHYSTSYVYSGNLWATEPENQPGSLKVLGFGYSDPDQTGKNELPGTARELTFLKSQLSGLFFSGLNATKQKFIEHVQDYDVIHLSMHGISDSVSRLNNRLLFRNPNDENQTDPLYTYELYNLRLNARLAVLSACESGIGKNFRGEGVYSMSRAFSYAGCPTTVMSLWRINDKTTPEILGQFYRQINKGMTVDQALCQAKLIYLDHNQGNLAHPNNWAAMVVHGTTEKVVNQLQIRLILPILIAVLFLSILMVRRNRKK